VAEVLLDLCLVPIAYYAAYRLRFEGPEEFTLNFPAFYRSLPLVLATQMTALLAVGIYRGVWRYFGLMDAIAVAKGVLLGAISAQLGLLYIFRFQGYSRTVFAIYGVILFIILMASRASFELIAELLHRNRAAATRVIVYGAGDGGSLAVRELLKAQGEQYRILGFIDDDAAKRRTRVQGFPVLGGYDSLVSLLLGDVVDTVVISARIMSLDRLRDLEALCAEHGVSLARFHVGLELIVAGEGASIDNVRSGGLFRKTGP
jgi:UDP-GlcNAc:undecaprenyl-phosphate/decaprenyl-phosphate GlcNAc-1-phosphate transferase